MWASLDAWRVGEAEVNGADEPDVDGVSSPEVDRADPEAEVATAGSTSTLSTLTSRPSKSNLIIASIPDDNARPRERHSSGAGVVLRVYPGHK